MPRKLRKGKKPMSMSKVSLHKTLVDNPAWRPDLDGEKAFPRKIDAVKNVKESTVEYLYSRNFLGISQKMAADQFRKLWEAAGGKISSLDYGLDRVDGGKGDPLVSRLQAAQELERAQNALGPRHYRRLAQLCGEGLSLKDIVDTKREQNTLADNLRADLDELASLWGYYATARSKPRRTVAQNKSDQRLYMAGKDRRVMRIRKQ